MDIWAGRHGQWAEEGEWERGVSHRQAVLLRCLAGLGSLAHGRQLGITALTALWLQKAPGQNIARKTSNGPYFMGWAIWAVLSGC